MEEKKISTSEARDNEKQVLNSQIDEGIKANPSYFYYAITLMMIQTVSSVFNLAFPYFELIPDLECKTKSGVWASCSKKEICSTNVEYRVDWSSEYSIVNMMTDLNLICESDYKIAMLGSIVFFGFLLSSFTIMPTPDIFGRKPVLIVTTILSSIAPFLILFTRKLSIVYILLFVYGFTILVRGTTSYVYCLEFVSKEKEKSYVSAIIILEKVVNMVTPLVFWVYRDWRFSVMLYFLISIACVIILLWIPESPKFLMNKMKGNNKGIRNWIRIFKNSGTINSISEENQDKVHFCDMLKQKRNLCNLIIMVLAWTFTSFSYYCVGFYMKYFRGSIYVNSFLMAFAGFLGVSVFSLMLNYMRNNMLFPVLFIISFLGSFGYTLTEQIASLLPLWILLMMFGLSMLFSLVYYANYYFFEAQYRTRVFSICNIVSRTFTILAPLSVEYVDNPLLIICICSLIMTVLSLFLEQSDIPEENGVAPS